MNRAPSPGRKVLEERGNTVDVAEYISEIFSFFLGLGAGIALTIKITNRTAQSGGTLVDQSHAEAQGDVVGGDKIHR